MATDQDLFQTIRAAIAAKGAADIAALRQSTSTRTRIRGALPALKVYPPVFELAQAGRAQAFTETFTLTYPGELVLSQAAGTDRAELEAMTLARALQIAWWSDTKLGIPTLVSDSWISSMVPSLNEYDLLAGYAITWQIRCVETLPAPGRSAT